MDSKAIRKAYENSLRNKNTLDCMIEIERLEKILTNQDNPPPMIESAYMKVGIVFNYVKTIQHDLSIIRMICRNVVRIRNAAMEEHYIPLHTLP